MDRPSIRSLDRPRAANDDEPVLAYAFDLGRRELLDGDTPVRLTEGEAKLLTRLAQSANMPIDRAELADEAADIVSRPRGDRRGGR